MKRILTICFLFLVLSCLRSQTCIASYLCSGSSDTYSFVNTSTGFNMHYYWNFGDGDGSNSINPIHSFPDDGNYLVTLFCHDTVSNCSNYTENWISVNKPDTFSCNLFFKDTIIGVNYTMTNLTTNCIPFYHLDGQAGPGGGGLGTFWFGGGWKSGLFISKLKAYYVDTITYHVYKEYFKTVKFNYSSALNYQDCSANFEVNITYQPNGALVNFSAMNRNATSYQWEIIGFGNPIYVTTPTTSHLYPYDLSYEKSKSWIVVLRTLDAVHNCGDTVSQNVVIKNPNYSVGLKEWRVEDLDLKVFPNPANDKLHLEFEAAVAIDKVTILNTLGQQIHTLLKPVPKQEIDVSHLNAGIYFLKAENRQGQSVFKVVKE